MRRWSRLLLCRWCGLLAVLAGLWSNASAQQASLDLAQVPARLALLDHLQVLHDAQARLEPSQALAYGRWRPATTRNLNPGLTKAALWLRLELFNTGSEVDTRWIAMDNPRLEEVYLYRFDGQRLSGSQRAGVAFPAPVPLARGLDAVFEVALAPGERVTLLLRVQGRTSIVMKPEIWSPQAYLEQESIDDLHYLLPIALTSGFGLYLLASNLARRSLPLFLLALWLLVGVAYDFTFHGYLRRYLLPEGGDLAARMPVTIGMLANAMLAVYVYVYLEMGRRRLWRLFYPLALIVWGLMVLLSLLGPLRAVIGLSSVVVLLFYLVWPFSLIQPWKKGVPHMRVFTLAMLCVWLFTMIRMSHYLGHWSMAGGFSLYVPILFKLLVGLVLLYAVVQHSASESRALAVVQSQLLAAQRLESERLEEAVRLRSAALKQAAIDADEAVRAKGELLARVGHDLRAPLSTIMAYAARLEAAGGAVQQRAQAIGRRAREQLALINGLIEYARAGVQPDAILLQALYLEAWLHSVADQAQELAMRHDNHFEWFIRGQLPDVVKLDAKRARQVLLLLLSHAAERACRGQVGLEVESMLAGDGAQDQTICLVFTVRDDGPAIPVDQLPTIFQPFLRMGMDQVHHEVGLGLAIAHQWAERMGGSLQVLGQPAQGAALRFTLPVSLGREADIAPRHLQRREIQSHELRGEGHRLWVAEDSPVVLEMLVTELSRMGFEVTPLSHGRDALDRLRDLKVLAPDLLLTDLKMPGVDGLTLLRSARARWPGLPVVLLTSAPEVVTSQTHDFSAVLAKPVSLTHLRRTLADLLGLELVQARMPEPAEGA